MEFDLFLWLNSMAYWHWWVLAALLIALEIMAPGYIFLWIAIAAACTGLLKLFIPISWEWQIIIFGALSLITVIYAKKFIKKYASETDQPLLNKKGQQFIGNVYTLVEAITDGSGRVKVGDSMWRVEGEDMPSGQKVKVTAVNGATLVVEKSD